MLRLRLQDIRSKLFIPGSRPEFFAKAIATDADALSFDLEDSVVAARKEEARHAVATFLQSSGNDQSKLHIVRVNSISSEMFTRDIEAVVVRGLHVINLPKVQSREEILTAVDVIEAAERKAGLEAEIGILANIETPKGLRLAFEIASAHPRVAGLQIGFMDFSLTSGIESSNLAALNAVRLGVRLAASEAGIAAFDGAFGAVHDTDGFKKAAEEARALGLNGKSCIHPSQIPLTNSIFSPSAREVDQAERIVAAADAAGRDLGAFLLDGNMIDVPIIERARRVLVRARHHRKSGSMENT